MCLGRRSFELLMRKLLSYKKRPAVLVLHYWSPGINTAGFVDTHEGQYESVVGLMALALQVCLQYIILYRIK
jgi:hypothetical protein